MKVYEIFQNEMKVYEILSNTRVHTHILFNG